MFRYGVTYEYSHCDEANIRVGLGSSRLQEREEGRGKYKGAEYAEYNS